MWELLHPYVEPYDAAIFTMPEYVKDDLVTAVFIDAARNRSAESEKCPTFRSKRRRKSSCVTA